MPPKTQRFVKPKPVKPMPVLTRQVYVDGEEEDDEDFNRRANAAQQEWQQKVDEYNRRLKEWENRIQSKYRAKWEGKLSKMYHMDRLGTLARREVKMTPCEKYQRAVIGCGKPYAPRRQKQGPAAARRPDIHPASRPNLFDGF